jgi:hypothetical protein
VRGRDLHLEAAAKALGVPYEDAEHRLARGDKEVREMRQHCKVVAFNNRPPRGLQEQHK